jgi:hypothetical protein
VQSSHEAYEAGRPIGILAIVLSHLALPSSVKVVLPARSILDKIQSSKKGSDKDRQTCEISDLYVCRGAPCATGVGQVSDETGDCCHDCSEAEELQTQSSRCHISQRDTRLVKRLRYSLIPIPGLLRKDKRDDVVDGEVTFN